MKAPNAEQTATSVLAAYAELVKQGAPPGRETREKAQAIVAQWADAFAPKATPTQPATATPTTEPATPGMLRFTQREVRAIFLFGAGAGALASLLLIAITFGLVVAAR